eukprot:gnl/Spiro4/17835_TR9487_c0_g1_i1.p1 gnl/Spiro4/17835_TR9487_c0_g1~~gnl/Spiro4/17835_TR9487_c0_g1_i1.p1  ORF type:complete len:308 (+),score=53.22 gnl/Spiro4/17835_TR9487_c0_g1_i1:65-988(+)
MHRSNTDPHSGNVRIREPSLSESLDTQLPTSEPVIAAPHFMLPPPRTPRSEWTTGALECCGQPGGVGLFCTALFCGCQLFGNTIEKTYGTDHQGPCCIFCLSGGCLSFLAGICSFGLQAIPASVSRKKFRKEHNIEGSCFYDFCLFCWCPTCALTQMYRELQLRQIDERGKGNDSSAVQIHVQAYHTPDGGIALVSRDPVLREPSFLPRLPQRDPSVRSLARNTSDLNRERDGSLRGSNLELLNRSEVELSSRGGGLASDRGIVSDRIAAVTDRERKPHSPKPHSPGPGLDRIQPREWPSKFVVVAP